MSTPVIPFSNDRLLQSYDAANLESWCHQHWEQSGVYRFDSNGSAPIFSVDTPPPYVSAAHLHVGHAMSYTQAEIVVRYQRMLGNRVFYPMGFDDNGLPTERYVERILGIDKRHTTRSTFRAHCQEETRRGAATYETLWRRLGLSVDWSLRYATIDPHCRHTAQRSFLRLQAAGQIRRAEEPVAWDPELETALAQADIELRPRKQKLHTLRFGDRRIATTRPELLPACVAVYHHPDDPRYRGLTELPVPLEHRQVPVFTDPDVEPDFGSGLMMVCTFGDADDVRRWRRDRLETRIRVGPNGRMLDGPGQGQTAERARQLTIDALREAGLYEGFTMVDQTIPVSERGETPVEWRTVPQWILAVMPHRERLKQAAAELHWEPAWMRTRLEQWIDGLRWDWTLSRQRFHGVPFPVWLCRDCGEAVMAREEDLPVDPLEDAPPLAACPRCGGALAGDPDVMDTWMTSSLTPQIHANRAGTPGRMSCPLPMSLRVQAHEIIRTWLFYTLLKGVLEEDGLPFRNVMISGWGLDEQGQKIQKRTLERATGPDGFNRYEPGHVMDRYGADALRHQAARAQLGHDHRYREDDVRAGRKVVVKLWNAGRLAQELSVGLDPSGAPPWHQRPPEDRDLRHQLDLALDTVAEGLDRFAYAPGLQALDRLLLSTFCDDWLETIKDRIRRPHRHPPGSAAAAGATLSSCLRDLLGAYAPYLPHVTECLWQALYQPQEGGTSIHLTRFPRSTGAPAVPEMRYARAVLHSVRAERTSRRMAAGAEIPVLIVDCDDAPELRATLEGLVPTLLASCRAATITFGPANTAVPDTRLRVGWSS